jgi:P4 family phage/plasmid primase-like protien
MESFLAARKTTHENHFNFLSMRENCKYLIEDDVMDEFLVLYEKELEDGKIPSISQRVRYGGHISVRCDIDIKRPIKEDVACFYQPDEVERMVEIYQNQIRKNVRNVSEDQLTCYVLEKQIKKTETHQKKGFHLEFPFIFLPKHEIKQVLLPAIKKEYVESDMFSRWDDPTIFDDQAVVSNPWLMYGSAKKEGDEPYLITKCFNSQGEEIDKQEINVSMFFINPTTTSKKYMRECIINTTLAKQDIKPLEYEKREYTIPSSVGDYLQECLQIAPMISEKAMTDYHSWRNVGQALFDLTNGSLDGLELFISLSSQAKNFSECACISFWKKAKHIGYNIGVLRNLAKRDCPEEYKRWNTSKSKHALLVSIKQRGQLLTTACADSLYLTFRDEYLYSPEDKSFYRFSNHKWSCIDMEGHELRSQLKILENPLTQQIEKSREELGLLESERSRKEDENGNPTNEEKKIKELNKQRTLYVKERNKLADTSFRDKIMKECKAVFLDREFANVKDTNKMLLGFTNGVLDLTQKIFRDGKPTDYITMTTGYDYVEQSTSKVDTYFNQVFVKDELRYYALNSLASCIEGENKHKKALFFTGNGDNSKSLLEKIIKQTFGEYFGLLPVSYFTEKKKGATPELNKVKQCRIVFVNEPSENDEFDVGLLKELTGNDDIQTRQLFKESDKTTSSVMFKLIVPCNKVPKIQSNDIATWNRIRVLPFESNFNNIPDEKSEYEFKKDENFTIDLEFKQAFMTKLFKLYKNGYDSYEPERVFEETRKFQAKNDTIQHFINTGLVKDDDFTITIMEAWNSFRTFFKSEYPDKKFTMVKDEFISYMKRYFKLEQTNTIKGYKIIQEQEEVVVEESKPMIDMDIENWKSILVDYQVSEKCIRHNVFFKKHSIHISLVKKFCKWFDTESGYKLVQDGTNPKKLFIEEKVKS